MKKLIFNLGFLLWCASAWAQAGVGAEPKTLFGPDTRARFFAAGTVHYSRVLGHDAWSVGGRAGVALNRVFALGLGGSFFANAPYYRHGGAGFVANAPADRLAAAYGGLYLEPLLPTRGPVHLAFPVLIGGGAASNRDWDAPATPGAYRFRSDGFFVVEPGLNVEVNLTRMLAVGLGATYRYAPGFDLPAVSRTALNGFTTGLTLKVGNL